MPNATHDAPPRTTPRGRRPLGSAFALAALAACASGGAPAMPEPTTRTDRVRYDDMYNTGRYDYTLTGERYASADRLAIPVDRAWTGLLLAYDQLSLPVEAADSRARTLASRVVRVRRQLGGRPLSRYLDCGTTATGPNANSYEVALRVRSSLAPGADSTGSMLRTVITATGAGTGNGGSAVPCASTGQLEREIANTAALRGVETK